MEQKEINWEEKEEKMFRKWLEMEKKEWESLAYRYKEIPHGIEQTSIRSIWLPEMYMFIQEHAQNYDYLYTYCFENKKGRTYFVEVGFGQLQFRMNVLFTKKEFRARLRFKESNMDKYFPIDAYALSNHRDEPSEMIKRLISLFSLYEEMKTFVLTKSPERLTIMLDGRKLEEEDLKLYKLQAKE